MIDDADRSDTGPMDDPADAATDSDRSPAAIVDGIDRSVLLFDGVCNLCNSTIKAIVRLDDDGEILFAPLQSAVGTELLERAGMATDYFDSVVLVEPRQSSRVNTESDRWKVSAKSTAILRVCRKLDGPVPLLYPLIGVPESVRNDVYDFVAEHRYQVFGKQDECPIPPEQVRQRFLERSLA